MTDPAPLRHPLVLDVEGMTCASCASRVERALQGVPGVKDAHVNYATHRAYLSADPGTDPSVLCAAVSDQGYGARLPAPGEVRRPSVVNARERSRTGRLLLLALILSSPFLAAHLIPGLHHLPLALQFVLSTAVVGGVGWPFHYRAFRTLSHGGADMDTLISLGSLAAWAGSLPSLIRGGESFFDAGPLIVTFILFGRYLEYLAKGRTGRAVEALMDLQPRVAHVVKKTHLVDVPVEAVGPEDLVNVRPGESFPVDGEVTEGRTLADESLLTGESSPVEKTPGTRVFGGTLNGEGTVTVRALAVGSDTVLSGILRMVEEAQGGRSPVERLADKAASVFVPSVLGVSALTFLLWWMLGSGGWGHALTRAVAVLVAACPCALGLATPTAVLVGTGLAARRGILFRRAEALENAASVQAVLFDKTGTLTEGKPRLVDAYISGEVTEEKALRYAAALETRSNHPLARALLQEMMVLRVSLPQPEEVRETPGGGLTGRVEGHRIAVGTKPFVEALLESAPSDQARAQAEAFRQGGQTISFLAVDGHLAAIFSMEDPLRADAAAAVESLKALGLEVHLLTGDGAVVAERVARRVGVDAYRAGALPADKLKYVQDLQAKGLKVCLVGDGYNDAPALAEADLGVALGTGTDAAREAGDVVLVKSELGKVAEVLRLSRDVLRVIKQNLFWAFGYNLVMVPLAALSPLPPALAALAMSLSSVTVVGNSLRLYGKWR